MWVVDFVPIRTDWVMMVVAGVRQAERDAERGNDFLSAETSAAVWIIPGTSRRTAQTKNSLREKQQNNTIKQWQVNRH